MAGRWKPATSASAACASSAGPSHIPALDPRPRPNIFRALGKSEPPEIVEIDGQRFTRDEIFKHDSWAATGIYKSSTRRALCKFNRQQPVFIFPMQWLGRYLASREQSFMDRLAGITGIPQSLGPVCVDGRVLPNAISREYIEGHALAEGEWVDDSFFGRLTKILAAVHSRKMAHVDLHKRENILVDVEGRPLLIDFQISFALPKQNHLAAFCLGGLLRLLQQCDTYHLLKHHAKHRPDQAALSLDEVTRLRPWWIRVHRHIAVPFRNFRRGLLVWMGIRSKSGHAFSEAFPEIAHRIDAASG